MDKCTNVNAFDVMWTLLHWPCTQSHESFNSRFLLKDNTNKNTGLFTAFNLDYTVLQTYGCGSEWVSSNKYLSLTNNNLVYKDLITGFKLRMQKTFFV